MTAHKGKLVSNWTVLDGLRVHARVALPAVQPTLAPVVLVHGLSVSSLYMLPTATRLAAYRPVYAPDLPGFGRSDHPEPILGVPELADALVRWMDRYDITRPVMLGNSMGCQIIVDLAVRYPERIERAVLVGPTMDRQGRTALEQARRLFIDGLREPPSSVLTQLYDYARCGLRRTVGTLHYALEDRIEDKMSRIQIPTLIVRGSKDPIAPQEWVEELVQRLPQGRLVVIPGAPHATNYSAPERLAQVVLDFLAKEEAEVLPDTRTKATTAP